MSDIKNVTYPVMERFYTLQGEGAFAGQAAYFIRLGGCDVGCTWCDVKESWDMDAHGRMSVGELIANAVQCVARLVVITGGEPGLHELGPLTDALREAGFRVHIETSGTADYSGTLDWVTLSPKKFKKPRIEWLQRADELKVIVFHPSDLQWAEQFVPLLKRGCLLYLQPEWDKRDVMLPLIITYIGQHPQWQLSLQTHKYINIP